MSRPARYAGQWDAMYHHPSVRGGDMFATAIETEFGICVEMKNCALAESFLENDIYNPEDEAPLTLSWLSSRWHDSTASSLSRDVQKMAGYSLNNSRFVYQTTINYRRSLNLREGHGSAISEDVLNRDNDQDEFTSRHMEDRQQMRRSSQGDGHSIAGGPQQVDCAFRAAPKKMWIRHYNLSNGNGTRQALDKWFI